MFNLPTIDPLGLAWMGAIFLFFGEVAALLALPSLGRVVLFSTVAEVGYLLIGLGIGGPARHDRPVIQHGYQAMIHRHHVSASR